MALAQADLPKAASLLSSRFLPPVYRNGADYCLAALVQMHMLDPHKLRAAVSQAGRRRHHRGSNSSGALRRQLSPARPWLGVSAHRWSRTALVNAFEGGMTMLDIMVANARYFYQQALAAEAALATLGAERVAELEHL